MGIDEAAKTLGLSERQLRRRLEATAPLVAPYVRRGPKNSIQLDQSVIEILRAVEERRASGATLADARDWVAVSLRGEQGRTDGQPRANTAPDHGESWAVSALLEEKDRTIRRLETENERLRNEVDRLLPLALPAPVEEESRPWYVRLLHRIAAARS